MRCRLALKTWLTEICTTRPTIGCTLIVQRAAAAQAGSQFCRVLGVAGPRGVILLSCRAQHYSHRRTSIGLRRAFVQQNDTHEPSGTLHRSTPAWFETLELKTNGTYLQVFTNSTVARTNAGQWTFQPPILTLKSALIFDDGFGRPATPVVTNDWKLKARYLINIWVLEDRQNEPFSQVTAGNQ